MNILNLLPVLFPYLSDTLLDLPLQELEDNGGRLDLCSQEPATYTEATSTYTLGNKTGLTYTGPADRSPNGRKTTVDAITSGGNVTGTGTASHWGISYVTGTELYAAGSLASSQAVTSGNTFTLTAFDMGLPDAT